MVVVLAVALLVLLPGLAVAGGTSRPAVAPTSRALPRDVPVLAPGGDFPTYLGDEERTSSSVSERLINASNAGTLHPLWTYNAGDEAVQSQPVEQNGTVYVGGATGYEYALNALNGSLRWKTFLGQDWNDSTCPGGLGVTSTATVAGQVLYVDGGYPYLYALNTSTGAIEWRALIGGSDSLGYYDWSSPLIFDGHAYVGISSDCDEPLVPAGLAEYSLTTHAQVGYFNDSVPGLNGSSIWGSPAIDPSTNTIFIATGNPYSSAPTAYSESIVALNASTLAVVATWQIPASQVTGDGDFGTTPTVFAPPFGSPLVTAPNKNGILYAFYQSNLSIAWQQPICCQDNSQAQRISTAWGGGYVYAVSAETTIGGVVYNSSVRAFQPLTGAIVWQDGFPESSDYGYAGPLWADGLLIVLDQSTLLVLNATDGSVLYQYTANGTFEAPPSVARGEIYAAATDGSVIAFDLQLRSTASDSAGSGPLSETFAVRPSGGLPPYEYSWTFGDGGSSTLPTPQHAYGATGTYFANVTVTDLAGSSITDHLVDHVELLFAVTFTETGVPAGTDWSVGLGAQVEWSTNDTITFLEPNGTYSYGAANLSGYSPSPASGQVTVNGAAVRTDLLFTPTYSLTITETGLPSGTTWTFTLEGSTLSSTSTTIRFTVPNGTYSFALGAVPGYEGTPASGSIAVDGKATSLAVSYRSLSSAPNNGSSTFIGLPASEAAVLLVALLTALAAAIAAAVMVHRRRKTPPKGPAPSTPVQGGSAP